MILVSDLSGRGSESDLMDVVAFQWLVAFFRGAGRPQWIHVEDSLARQQA